jgi:polyphosphate kinase 2 (PPK2 family)
LVRKYFLYIDEKPSSNALKNAKTIRLNAEKLTAEDWRNRGKWAAYETATEDMLRKTHHQAAP